MKRNLLIYAALLLVSLTACGKKINVTIDGRAFTQFDRLYLIVNEDTANAILVDTPDGRINTTLKVEKNDFIRIDIQKNRMESNRNILIADSRHITVDLPNGTCEGSPLSQKLQQAIKGMEHAFPRDFHIDCFSDDPEERAKSRAQEKAIRADMEEKQAQLFVRILKENADNIMPAWLVYSFDYKMIKPISEREAKADPAWAKHPLLQKR